MHLKIFHNIQRHSLLLNVDLLSGGPGAAHEAEQFAWNDHVVIPVRNTGGAASGKFKVPGKIFEA